MSRSYKKKPILKYAPIKGKYGKKLANKKVRLAEEVPDGKQYRRFSQPWDIHDCVDRHSWQDEIDRCVRQNGENPESEPEQPNRDYWEKYFYRK